MSEYRRTGAHSKVLHRVEWNNASSQWWSACHRLKTPHPGRHALRGDRRHKVTCKRCQQVLLREIADRRVQLGELPTETEATG